MVQSWKFNKTMAIQKVKSRGHFLHEVCFALKEDREVVLAAVTNDGSALEAASPVLWSDFEIVKTGVLSSFVALRCASEELKDNKEIVMAAVLGDPRALAFASLRLKNDREVVLGAVSTRGRALQYASLDLRCDREVLLTAFNNDGSAYEFCCGPLRQDRDMIYAAVKRGGLRQMPESIRDDKKLVLLSIEFDVHLYVYASPRLRNDPDVAIAAIRKNASIIHAMPDKLTDNPVVMMEAVRQHRGRAAVFRHTVGCISDRLIRCRDFVLEAVSIDGRFLNYAWPGFLDDKDIVLKALEDIGYVPVEIPRCVQPHFLSILRIRTQKHKRAVLDNWFPVHWQNRYAKYLPLRYAKWVKTFVLCARCDRKNAPRLPSEMICLVLSMLRWLVMIPHAVAP